MYIKELVKAQIDFEYFCKECLGYKEMNDEHEKLCKFMVEEVGSKLVLMPRYSFKSSIATIGYGLWRMVRDVNIRILIYSDSSTKAEGFLQGIKNHIEGKGSKFREWYGSWETDVHKGKWNESQIVIRVREKDLIEPSVDTGGIESSKVGMHYDLIIFDDIVSDLNVTTRAQMDKVYDCYKKSLSLLKPGGEVVMVGTRWNFGDTYGRIIESNDFKVFLRASEVNGVYPFESIGLTKEFLEKQRKDQGSYIYSCLYLNNPVNDDDAIFKHDDFTFYGKVNPEDLYITATCDPAGQGNDCTAITIVGTDKNLNIYILDLVNAHLKPNEIVETIIKLSYKWKFKKLGVETNFFKGLLEQEIKLAMEEERNNNKFQMFGIDIFVASIKAGEGKHARILSLQPYHERGALRFPGESVERLKGAFSDLTFQMLQYTPNHRPMHDDVLDALAYQVKMIRPGGTVKEDKVPENSAAAIEKANYDAMIRMNKFIPMRHRKKFHFSFN